MLLPYETRIQIRKTPDFQTTNKTWNDLYLNATDNIGAVMALIKDSNAQSFEEWEKYYLDSGEKRRHLLAAVTDTKEKNNINRSHGRTKEDLFKIAKILAQKCNISEDIAFNYVYIRVIDETWIGHNRELEALKVIQQLCFRRCLTVNGVDSLTDTKYAIDFEVREQGQRILAIQLKSTRYKYSKTTILLQTKKMNQNKNKKYTERFGVDVLYLYMNPNGHIVNLAELEERLAQIVLNKLL